MHLMEDEQFASRSPSMVSGDAQMDPGAAQSMSRAVLLSAASSVLLFTWPHVMSTNLT